METALFILAALFGNAIHLLKKTVEERQGGADTGVLQYVQDRPYRTALGIAAALAALMALHEAGQLTLATAVGVGYMADSALALLKTPGGPRQ